MTEKPACLCVLTGRNRLDGAAHNPACPFHSGQGAVPPSADAPPERYSFSLEAGVRITTDEGFVAWDDYAAVRDENQKLKAQAQSISVVLSDAGFGPCTLPEGVASLAADHARLREERDAENERARGYESVIDQTMTRAESAESDLATLREAVAIMSTKLKKGGFERIAFDLRTLVSPTRHEQE